MKSRIGLIIGLIVVAILAAYMVTYQVRYDQIAVVTTLESVQDPVVDPETGEVIDPGSIVREPGLRFKAPWPIQQVHAFSTKLQVVESTLTQIQTEDGSTVNVKLAVFWRVEDPLAYYRAVGTSLDDAREKLSPLLGDLEGIITQYRFDQLVNNDPEELAIIEMQEQARDALREQLAGLDQSYGIAIESVALRRLLLPELTTEAVFERMRSTRQRMAENARAEGEAEAGKLREEAESIRQRIMAFAERRAQAIRSEGEQEAAEQFQAFAVDEDFAIFLRNLEALEQTLPNNTTLILDARQLEWLSPLVDPSVSSDANE
jgi:modulator of FtsH protease HflC